MEMYVKTLLFLSVGLFVSGFKCPEYCTCTETFISHTEEKVVTAKCSKIDGLNNFTDMLSNINVMDLSTINLSELSTSFNSFKVLSDVNLSNNNLSTIPKLNNRITNLSLSHNQLTSSSILKLPLHVQNLNLSHNQISSVSKDVMRLNRLRKFELAGNPIDCDCDSIRVRNWLIKHFVATDESITCVKPKQFENISWLEINEFDVCEFERIKKTEQFIETDHESMLADESIVNLETSEEEEEGSGDDETTTPSDLLPRNVSLVRSSGMPYFVMAKEVMDLLPKKKSEDGQTEVFATSGTAGLIIIGLTIFAVYKKHQTGGANIETGEDGKKLKTIGGLELAKANALVMAIDKQAKSEKETNLKEVVKPAEDIQNLPTTTQA